MTASLRMARAALALYALPEDAPLEPHRIAAVLVRCLDPADLPEWLRAAWRATGRTSFIGRNGGGAGLTRRNPRS